MAADDTTAPVIETNSKTFRAAIPGGYTGILKGSIMVTTEQERQGAPGENVRQAAVQRIHDDIMHLAGRLIHRGAQTEQERLAADFLEERLRTYTPDIDRAPFASFDNHRYLFASFYAEFAIVCFGAIWIPAGAALYGIFAFAAYLAEFMGYAVVSRLLPRYDSQNVIGRFLGLRPKGLIILHAHYDSGCASPMTLGPLSRLLRPLHGLMVLCMAVIIATCVASAAAQYQGAVIPHIVTVRWFALGILMAGALMLFIDSGSGDEIRGANVNASGVAAALEVASRIAALPLDNTDVWVAFTGSNEAWMSGTRVLLQQTHLERASTHFLNLEGVGAGTLAYTKAEGMLHASATDILMRKHAAELAGTYGVSERNLRAVPSGAHIPLSRGIPAMSIMGLGDDGLPPYWNHVDDRVTILDENQIARAADYTEAILRGIDHEWSQDA